METRKMATEDITATAPSLEPRVAVLEHIAAETVRALDRLERRLEALDKRHHTDFLWMLSLQLGSLAALLGVMAHGFKWL
jgi:hypothetical protein